MKHISKKLGLEKVKIKGLSLYTRAKVGTHIGMVLDEGKDNSIILGITHANSLSDDIKTISCDFSSLAEPNLNNEVLKYKNDSRAILTIVDKKTMLYKDQKVLGRLAYKTGLIHSIEQERLREKILLQNKITYLSNVYNSKDTYILYQTKTKTEAISLNNNKRLIELVGIEVYEKHFRPLHELGESLGEKRLSIAEILQEKISKEGIEGLIKIIEKITL
jgi:hypothetical protein